MPLKVAALAGLILSLALPSSAAELPAEEKARIEQLIEHVKGLKDAAFVRNGVEYDAATAAKFLQGKWDANAAKIATARQFIDKAASASSTTGKPYLIRFKQGGASKEVKSGDYLLEQLKRIEKR
ncbi:MAG: DUF5329 family protein [Pirellulaceae bacterium]